MADDHRLFFALWPEGAVAEKLHAAAQTAQETCAGRLMRRETLHLTLAFLGHQPAQRQVAAEAVAATIDHPSFELALDRLGYWPHNRILWAGCTAPPPALASLAASLDRNLRAEGFALDRRPFAAHATLLRNAHGAPDALPPLAPIPWSVAAFVLVESIPTADGSRYEILRRWPLAAPVA